MNRCALCGDVRSLRQSHVIPELLYRPLYDDKHRTILLAHGAERGTILQKGLREPMLCDACEKRLHVYEDYFDKRWSTALPDPLPRPLFTVEVDYRKMKLFMLSILWRASVSRLDSYKAYSLGPHQEIIRHMILNDAPGPMDRYPLMGGAIIKPDDGRPTEGLMLAPVNLKVDGHWAARIIFAGVAWTILTSSHRPSEGFYGLMLDESGALPLFTTTLDKVANQMGLREAVANLKWPLEPSGNDIGAD